MDEGTPWLFWVLSGLSLAGGPGFIILLILVVQLCTLPFEKGATMKSVLPQLRETVGWFFKAVIYTWIGLIVVVGGGGLIVVILATILRGGR